MSILFSIIFRGSTVLAKFASCAGNFSEVSEQIMSKIPHNENSKMTYSHESYLFHYVSEDNIFYLCITDDDFERSKAFMYLNKIKRRLPPFVQSSIKIVIIKPLSRYKQTKAAANALASGSRPSQMNMVQEEVDELRGILVQNIDKIADRGERLELLVDKTEELRSNSVVFKRSSRGLARSMWLKNVKITVITVVAILIILYFIISAVCGGLDWPCTH